VRKAEWEEWDGDAGLRPPKWGTIQFELLNFAFDRPTAEERKDWDSKSYRAYVQALLNYLETYFPPQPVLSSLHRLQQAAALQFQTFVSLPQAVRS